MVPKGVSFRRVSAFYSIYNLRNFDNSEYKLKASIFRITIGKNLKDAGYLKLVLLKLPNSKNACKLENLNI